MRTVYKYPILMEGSTLVLPDDAVVVHVGMQNLVTIWVELDKEAPVTPRHFAVFGTGHQIPDGWSHCGTFFDGPFVWHVYEQRVS